MPKKLDQLRSGQEFVDYAEKKGAFIRQGKGSHVIISTDQGQTVVPVHSGDLGKGLRHKIIKAFIAMGIGLFIIGFMYLTYLYPREVLNIIMSL